MRLAQKSIALTWGFSQRPRQRKSSNRELRFLGHHPGFRAHAADVATACRWSKPSGPVRAREAAQKKEATGSTRDGRITGGPARAGVCKRPPDTQVQCKSNSLSREPQRRGDRKTR